MSDEPMPLVVHRRIVPGVPSDFALAMRRANRLRADLSLRLAHAMADKFEMDFADIPGESRIATALKGARNDS